MTHNEIDDPHGTLTNTNKHENTHKMACDDVQRKTLTRWECNTCGKTGLLNNTPTAGWHQNGWHVSAQNPLATQQCTTTPTQHTYTETDPN